MTCTDGVYTTNLSC